MHVTGSHAHTKWRVKLQFCMLKSSASRREACFSCPSAAGTGHVFCEGSGRCSQEWEVTRDLPLLSIGFISRQDCYRQRQFISTFFPDITSQELQLQAQTQSTMKVLVVSECAVLLRGESLQSRADHRAAHMNQIYTFKPTFFYSQVKKLCTS
jgi:hypothetical protein